MSGSGRRGVPSSRTARARGSVHSPAVQRSLQSERARIARRIHDGLLQELYVARTESRRLREMSLTSGAVEVVDRITEILDRMNTGARDTVRSLESGDSELPPPLADVAAEMSLRLTDRYGLEVDQKVIDEPSFSPTVRAEIASVITEAGTNAGRHARASRCVVRGYRIGRRFVITVRDDGVGIVNHRAAGFGMRHMRERCALIGASFSVRSRAGVGTVVRVSVELSRR